MVPERGLEPPRIAPLVPETSVSTNFTTRAHALRIFTGFRGFVNFHVQCRKQKFH